MRIPTITALLLTALLVGSCAARGNAAIQHSRVGAELLQAAEQSFSNIPFGTREPPPSLTLIADDGCVDGRGECTYMDANHVQHHFVDNTLVIKSIDTAHVSDRPIAALGIGKARALNKVLERVRRFLPEAEVDCDEYATDTTCGATLGDGWIKLFFDDSRRLTEVRIDAYHFI